MDSPQSSLPRRPKPLNNLNGPKVSSPLASPTTSIGPGTNDQEGNGKVISSMDGTDKGKVSRSQLAEASGGYIDTSLRNGTGSSSHLPLGALNTSLPTSPLSEKQSTGSLDARPNHQKKPSIP